MSLEANVNQAIPSWKRELKVQSWGDLQNLGRQNVEALTGYKKSEIRSMEGEVKKLDTYTSLLEGKSGADIAEMAKQFTDPKIPRDTLAKKADSWGDDLEPTRAEDINRERGSTNYNNCGWCDNATSGSARYNYMISTGCSLLSYAGKESGNRGVATEGCLITSMTADEIGELVDSYKARKADVQSNIKEAEDVVAKMEEVASQAEDKPYLPDLRPHDHFNISDRVVSYIPEDAENCFKSGFMEATVISGYRHHDGCVSFVTDEPFHKGDYEAGKGSGAGAARADTMLKSEFDFLQANPDFAKVWIANIEERVYTLQFKEALLQPSK